MPLISKKELDGYTIALWKIDEDEKTLLSLISNIDDYAEELTLLKATSRRKEWLSVRAMLNSVVGDEKIEYRESGKPYLKSGKFNISISHTASYVSIILSKDRKVAIDIEKYGDRVKKVASRFIGENENVTPFRGDDIWSMILHWSAKESAFKMIDSYDVDFRKDLIITPFITQECGVLLLKERKSVQQETLHINYQLYDDFVMTWCVK